MAYMEASTCVCGKPSGCWKWAVLSGLYIIPPHPALFGFFYRQVSISVVINEVGARSNPTTGHLTPETTGCKSVLRDSLWVMPAKG